MSFGIVKRVTGTFLLFMLALVKGFPQNDTPFSVRLMFYNVENLFDIYDDTLTDDDEFLPDGLRRWNYTRYTRKINSLGKTILAAGEWEPPAIIAFCEVENRKVLNDLIRNASLAKYGYEIVHEDSPDERGIDVALIYRKEALSLVNYSYLNISEILGTEDRTRDILYTKFLICRDTIHLFVNHWPSRRGGVMAGEGQRLAIARILREKIDTIVSNTPGRHGIIVMGDFNATSDDNSIRVLTGEGRNFKGLRNLSENLAEGFGTYRYMGIWETIDQILVSEDLITGKGNLNTDTSLFRIFGPGFLLKEDAKYPGLSPFPTYSGYRYSGGYSDHLPVLLDIMLK